LLALCAALPYVALQYRRRGTVGAGHLFLAGAFGLYLVGVAFSVILPLRPVGPNFCALYEADAHLNPFYLLDQLRLERATGGWAALLGNADFQDLVLNVFLFIPMGVFVRHLLRKGVSATIAIGLGVSLAIELTQLTGNWGLYPCAYRFFSTSDLITNTTGAAIGAVCALLLRLVPAQLATRDPGDPQPVTPMRRFLAAGCNGAVILILGLFLLAMAGLILEVTRGQLFASASARAQILRAVTLVWIPGLVVMLGVPLAWQGRTPGEWAVLLRRTDANGEPVEDPAIVGRFLAGPAPLLLLAGLGILGAGWAWVGLLLVGAFNAAAVARRGAAPQIALADDTRIRDSR